MRRCAMNLLKWLVSGQQNIGKTAMICFKNSRSVGHRYSYQSRCQVRLFQPSSWALGRMVATVATKQLDSKLGGTLRGLTQTWMF